MRPGGTPGRASEPTGRSLQSVGAGHYPEALPDTPLRLISQLNLWFRGWPEFANYFLNGRRMIPFDPLLGLTDSSDREILRQEMQWIGRYTGDSGANFIYSLEWIKPEFESNEVFDSVIDGNLRSAFLPELAQTRSRFNIFYDPVLAPLQRLLATQPPIDYSRSDVFRMFVSDLDYLQQYFDHPRYWRIDGKPVLYLWAVPDGMVRAEPALNEARRRGLYVLGDTFGRPGSVPPMDGRTGFVAATPEIIGQGREWELGDVMPFFERYYQPSDDGADVIPALSCQFDDTEFRGALGDSEGAVRILARERGDVEAFLELARSHARPIGGERYVFAGTLDNWAEGTTLLPSEIREPAFSDQRGGQRRIGYYGFEHLEAVRRALFPEIAAYEGPRLVERRGRVLFNDCDLMGDLVVSGSGVSRLRNVPKWKNGRNLERLADFRRAWTPRWRRGTAERRVELSFRNLDGRSTVLEVS